MNALVKICGLSTPEAVAAAATGGASHLGFIFFAKSPRNVLPHQAAALVSGVGDGVQTVAVSVDAEDDFLDEIVGVMKPDILQLHGSETPQRVQAVKARYGLPVMKAIAVREAGDIDRAKTYDGIADMVLLDAKPPAGSNLPGGNGVSFDWSLVGDLKTRAPLLLSGGLAQENLKEALRLVESDENSFAGLDVSSGVESAPGVKDVEKIRAFLAACRP